MKPVADERSDDDDRTGDHFLLRFNRYGRAHSPNDLKGEMRVESVVADPASIPDGMRLKCELTPPHRPISLGQRSAPIHAERDDLDQLTAMCKADLRKGNPA